MLFASQHTECKRQLVPQQLKTLTLRHLSQPKFVQFIQLVGDEKTQFYPQHVLFLSTLISLYFITCTYSSVP